MEKIVEQIVNPAIYLLIGVAVVVFLWGAVEFVARADDPTAKSEGAKHLLWGLFGLVIIFGVFGFLNLIQNTLVDLFK